MRNVSIAPFIKNMLFATMASFIVVVCNISIVKIMTDYVTPEQFGLYTIIRRFSTSIYPFTSFAIATGIVRYTGFFVGEKRNYELILPTAVGVSLLTHFFFIICVVPFAPFFSSLIFNSPEHESLVYAMLFYLVGFNFYMCLNSHYRGIQNIITANIWALFITGILQVTVIYSYFTFGFKEILMLIYLIGSIYYLSIFSLLFKLKPIIMNSFTDQIFPLADKLIRYSIPRAPGGVALALLLSLGVIISPYTGNVSNAGYLAIGIWCFQILLVATSAFGMVFLPKAAQICGEDKMGVLKDNLRVIYDFTHDVGLFSAVQIFIVIDFIIEIWVGVEYMSSILITKILLIALIPYFFYTMLRTLIDAIEVKAINTFNLYPSLALSCAICLVSIYFDFGITGVALGMVSGIWLLGVLTYNYLVNRFLVSFFTPNSIKIISINMLFFIIVYTVKNIMLGNIFSTTNLAIILLLQLILSFVYLVYLSVSSRSWVQEVRNRISF